MAIHKAAKADLRLLAPVVSAEAAAAPSASKKTIKQQRAKETLPGLAPSIVKKRNDLARKAEKGIESPEVLRRWAAEGQRAPSYFRTYEQVRDSMKKLAADHPQLVSFVDIGDSFEKVKGKADRDINVIKITSPKSTGGKKPSVLYFGGQHAREIANPEMLMRFANWLVDNYGKDPQATALLDTREIHILPMVNPDGHAVVERGYAGARDGDLMKRKNTSGKDGEGTDPNRNWATKNWGTAGISHSQSSDVYCGPSPASEYEIQAIQKYIEDQKFNLTIDWHSYSELVLYPPDDDAKNTVPDQAAYVRVGKKFAGYNGYTPEESVDLYPTSGGSFWPYEKQGTAAFAIETGTAFHQSDSQYEDTWKRNFPVMMYAATIADDWKKSSSGPDVESASIDASGNLSVAAPGVAVEMVRDINAAPGSGLKTISVQGKKGEFTLDNLFAEAEGRKQLVYVRAQDANGAWGPLKALWLVPPLAVYRPLALRAQQAELKKSA